MVVSSTSTSKRLREIFELLLRTMKTLSLYEARNPVSERLETELHHRLTKLLEDEGPLALKVLNHQILLEDEVVYENQERKESLAFLLSRDGIRSLIFQPGLQPEETRSFVSCLNRARVLVGGEDDLATLLWEQDFESIDYFVIDDLADGATGEVLGEGLSGTGWSAEPMPGSAGVEGGGAGSDSAEDARADSAEGGGDVTLQDVQPSPRLPVAAAQLSGSEIEALHNELAEENLADLSSMAVELAVELVMLEPNQDEQQTIATALAGIFDELLVQKKPEELLRSFERLSELAGQDFASEGAVANLYEVVRHAVAQDGPLGRFLRAVEGRLELTDRAERFLGRLPDTALPTLLDRLGRLHQSRLRRAVSDAILVHGDRGPRELMNRLPALRAAGEDHVIDELLHMVHDLPEDSAFPLVERLLSSGDSEVARRAALVLGHLKGERFERLFLDLLEEGSQEMRPLAIGALAHSGNRALAPRLLKKALEPTALKPDSEEIRRQLAAIGRLGGDSILPAFDELLQARSQGWFVTRERRELVRALVRGVRAIGSTASGAYLEKLGAEGNRLLRRICREELAGGER